jgi:hypothetical protein
MLSSLRIGAGLSERRLTDVLLFGLAVLLAVLMWKTGMAFVVQDWLMMLDAGTPAST